MPAKIFPIFRDEDELPAGSGLSERIRQALDHAKTLIVICSPGARASAYVDSEIRYFKSLGRSDSIFPVIIEGDQLASSAQSGLPKALRFRVEPWSGELTTEPAPDSLAADLRLENGSQGWTDLEAYRKSLRTAEARLPRREISKRVEDYGAQVDQAKLRLVAGVLGIDLRVLTEREKMHQIELQRKRARFATAIASIFLVLAVGAGIAAWMAIMNQRLLLEEREVQRAYLRSASRSEHAASELELDRNNWQKSMAHVGQALEFWDANLDAASWAESILSNHPYLKTRWVMSMSADVACLSYSPDGRILVVGSRGALVDDRPSLLAISSGSGDPLWDLPLVAKPEEISFSHDGSQVVIGLEDNTTLVVAVESGAIKKIWSSGGRHVTTSSKAPWLAFGDWTSKTETQSTISLASFDDFQSRWSQPVDGAIRTLAFDPVEARIALGGDFFVEMRDLQSGEIIWRTLTNATIRDISFSPDGERLAASGLEEIALVMDSRGGTVLWRNAAASEVDEPVSASKIQFSPDGRFVASSSHTGVLGTHPGHPATQLRILSAATGTSRFAVRTRNEAKFAFSYDGKILVMTDTSSLSAIDLESGKVLGSLVLPGRIHDVLVGPHNRSITVTSGASIRNLEFMGVLSPIYTGPAKIPFEGDSVISSRRIMERGRADFGGDVGENYAVTLTRFSPDGLLLALGGDDEHLRIFSFPAGRELWRKDIAGEIDELAFSEDGSALAFLVKKSTALRPVAGGHIRGLMTQDSMGSEMVIVDSRSGESFWSVSGGNLRNVVFLDQGPSLLAGGRLWDRATGSEIGSLDSERNIVVYAFDKENQKIAQYDGQAVSLRRGLGGKEIWSLEMGDRVSELLFLDQGRLLAVVLPRRAEIYGVANGDLILKVEISGLRLIQAQGSTVLAMARDRVVALALRTGEILWDRDLRV